MSVHDSNARRRSFFSTSRTNARRGLACAALTGIVALSAVWSCGGDSTSSGNSGSFNSGSGSGSGTSGNGGTGATGSGTGATGSGTGTTGTGAGATGTTGTGTGATGSGTGTTGTATGTAGTGTGTTGTATGTTGTATGTTGTTGTSTGVKDGGADATLPPGDGGVACTNTDMTKINIDSSGVACNNQWGIHGAWYCFSDPAGSSTSCPAPGTGIIPYNAASGGMCLSGTTVAQLPGSTSYGASLGLELNHPQVDAGLKQPYNASAQSPKVLGFAITIVGTTGGANLNINFPPPLNALTQEAPGIAVPGVATGFSPITYNALLQDAIISDNTAAPIPKVVDPTDITAVEVAVAVDDTPHAYNFCITKIVPITAAPAAPATQVAYGPKFTEAKQIVLTGLGPYGVQNDPFNVGPADSTGMQVTYGGGLVGFTATPTFGSTGSTPGAFPSIAYGWIHGGNFVGGSEPGGYNGGKTIAQLTSVRSTWSFTPGTGNWDAAYDCWFGGNANSVNAATELMVWLNHANVTPIGGAGTAVTVANATNGPWTISTGTNNDAPPQPVVSYVTTAGTNMVTNFNLLPFFVDAAMTGKASLTTSSFFLGCQAGFELYNAGTWTTTSYSMTAN